MPREEPIDETPEEMHRAISGYVIFGLDGGQQRCVIKQTTGLRRFQKLRLKK